MNKTVCAVVVTYNRKDLLLHCLNAIAQQSYPVEHIVVVNNASQDGTVASLTAQGWTDKPNFTLLNLSDNQGGAGGFYEGIKYASKLSFDYIWLMDDDGYPAKDCLANLIPYCTDKTYIGPMVLDNQDKETLSFALRLPHSLAVIDSYASLPSHLTEANYIDDIVLPFNGTLISANIIEQLGLPHKDYFIWGDEKEYTLRATKNHIKIRTIVNAIFYHPKQSSMSTPMFFNRLRFNDTDSRLKLYCFCRNSIAIYKAHYGLHYMFAFALKALWFYLFTHRDLAKLSLVSKAIYHGFIGDFSHHKDYL